MIRLRKINYFSKLINMTTKQFPKTNHPALVKLPFFPRLAFMLLLAIVSCSTIDEGAIPITTTSSDAREFFLEGRELAERLRRVEAHELFTKAIAEDSNFALAHLGMANTHPSARGFFESFAKAKALIDSVSEGERLLILAGEAGINGNQVIQEELLLKLIELYPTDARAQNGLGLLYFGQQRFDLAIERFKQSIALSPELSSPYNQLGYCYRFTGDLDKAAETFQKYTDLIPDDPNPHDSYAELLLKQGEYELSIESYSRALSLDPGFIASYIGIASNLCYLGKHDEARNELQQLYAVAHNDGQRRGALYGIAATYLNEMNLDSAKNVIRRAQKIAEKVNDIRSVAADFNTLALFELEQDNLDAARLFFDSAATSVRTADLDDLTQTNSERTHLYNITAWSIRSGKLREADSLSAEFTKQMATRSNIGLTALAHQLAGMVALAENNFDEALTEFAQANPRSTYNHYRIALALRGRRENQKAAEELRWVVDFNSVLAINYSLVRGRAMTLLDSLTNQ